MRFLRTLFRHRQSPRVLALIAEADDARDRGEWARARDLYRSVLDQESHRAGVWTQYGHALKANGSLHEAEEAYRHSIERRPDCADTYVQIGHLRRLLGRTDEAAADYICAVELDPNCRPALEELRDLRRRGVAFDHRRVSDALALLRAYPLPIRGDPGKRAALVFDLADLVRYARERRRPSGIQRVQISLVAAVLARLELDRMVNLCAFNEDRGEWVALPVELFGELSLAMTGSALSDDDQTDWRVLVDRVSDLFDFGPAYEFQPGETLVNLGASWATRDYLLHIRRIKDEVSIRYVPFVHDMIPVVAAEHCVPSLVLEFADWMAGAVDHADAFLTNSLSSAHDLSDAAARLQHPLPPERVAVIRLDADPRTAPRAQMDRGVLGRLDLEADRYVLLVSTIESRKNHAAAIKAWATLCECGPPSELLPLICVGNPGWRSSEVYADLSIRPELSGLVRFIGAVSDPELASLYCGCAFAFYPSRYEGWGLPVTEALSYGKAILTSDASSLPEAGGGFAVQFRLDDPDDLVAQLTRLMKNAEARRRLEQRTTEAFHPRSWTEIAADMLQQLDRWGRFPPRPAPLAPVVQFDSPFLTQSVGDPGLVPGRAEAERSRGDAGWWPLEPQGVWTREGGGLIVLRAPSETGDFMLEVALRSPPWPTVWRLTTENGPTAEGGLEPGEDRVVALRVPEAARRDGVIRFSLTSNADILSETGENRRFGVGLKGFVLSRPL